MGHWLWLLFAMTNYMYAITLPFSFLAARIGFPTSSIKIFELETRRPDGSPTKKILWDLGTRGGTVREFYNKLAYMNKAQVMRLLDPISKYIIQQSP